MPPDRSVARLQHAGDDRRLQAAAADVDQRAHQDPDHVLEEGRRLDVERDDGALSVDVQAADDPAGGAAIAVRGAEGAEVVLADQQRRRRPDGVQVQRLPHVPGGASAPRRAHEMAPDGVAVDLPARGEARVEVRRGLGDLDQRDVRRQDRVQAAQQAVRRHGLHQVEADHLAVGVNAGVGPAGGPHEDAFAQHLVDRVLDDALDGAPPVLALPTRKVGPVVLDDGPPASRRRRVKTRTAGPGSSRCHPGACGSTGPGPRCPSGRTRT